MDRAKRPATKTSIAPGTAGVMVYCGRFGRWTKFGIRSLSVCACGLTA